MPTLLDSLKQVNGALAEVAKARQHRDGMFR
jgi:hypothetical protein